MYINLMTFVLFSPIVLSTFSILIYYTAKRLYRIDCGYWQYIRRNGENDKFTNDEQQG